MGTAHKSLVAVVSIPLSLLVLYQASPQSGEHLEYSKVEHIRKIGKAATAHLAHEVNSKRSGKSGYSYAATLTFVTDKGQQIREHIPIREDLVSQLRAEKQLIVLYDPARPQEFVTQTRQPLRKNYLMYGGLYFLGSVGLLVFSLREWWNS